MVFQRKNKTLSVKIDSAKTSLYSLNTDTNVLTITDLNTLFNGTQVSFESVDEYFILSSTKDKIVLFQ